MQARVDWVPITFGTQVIKTKRAVRPVFSDYLSVSYDYGLAAIGLVEMEKSIFISILTWISILTLEKAEITASIRHIARLLKTGVPIYNSDVPDTAGRKTRKKRRRR